MGWRTVVITQHAKVSYAGRSIVVQTDTKTSNIPIGDIDLLLVATTRAVITSAAISELAKNQTKVIFTDGSGQPITETVDYYPRNRTQNQLLAQFNWSDDRQKRLWTEIIRQKITNQIRVIDNLELNSSDLKKELMTLEYNDATNREAVVANKYFSLIFDAQFTRRSIDSVNGALNYGYAVILAKVNREIVCNGCLTQLGIHHHNQENDFNLGSDLMEPFRPCVDFWVQQQNFKDLTPDIKYGLIDLLNLQMEFNGKNMLLRTAIAEYVRVCLQFLNQKKDKPIIEVKIGEVSSNAIIGNV